MQCQVESDRKLGSSIYLSKQAGYHVYLSRPHRKKEPGYSPAICIRAAWTSMTWDDSR